MPAANKPLDIIALEREILRSLCCAPIGPASRTGLDGQSRGLAVTELLTYNWQHAEHRVVFEAVAKLPGRDAAELRSQLPAQATRMGFPDVNWETYFTRNVSSGGGSAEEQSCNIAALIASLREATRGAAL